MWSKLFTTVKYLLVVVNFIFVITGIIILSVGASVQAAYNEYHKFLLERFFSLPAFCIATGIIIFLIACLGFYGAYMENYIVTMTFAGAMILMFIFQLSACIAGYVLKGNAVSLVQHKLLETMDSYGLNKSVEVTKLWDTVQQEFQCCGVLNASQWLIPLNTTATNGLPISCCRENYGIVAVLNCEIGMQSAFTTGCSDSFGSWVQSHAAAIGASGIFLVLMQALIVAGAVWMAKISRDERGAYP